MNNGLCNPAVCTAEAIRDMIYGLNTPVRLYSGRLARAINLDNAATTPSFKKVVSEIERQLTCYGSIGRGKGQKSAHSTEVYTNGRSIVKEFVGASSDIYTAFYVSNTTDGINKLASALIGSADDVVLSTRMEHHANDLPWRERATVVYAEVDDKGRIILSDFERILREQGGKVKVVAVTAASNVTGYVNDVHAVARIAHQYGAVIVVDGAQIVAHRAFSMLGQTPAENIDFFVFSAHKMYAPFGGGAVVGLTEILNQHMPKFYGGGMVEAVCDSTVRYSLAPDRYEAGSPNYLGEVAMLEAILMLRRIGFDYIQAHEQWLMRKVLCGLKNIPGVTLYGDNDNIADRVGIIVFNIPGMKPERTADLLAGYRAIAVRHGAFCAHPYVRRLTGEQEEQVCASPEGMVRISFGIYNNACDVDCFLRTIREILCCSSVGALAGSGVAAIAPGYALPNDRG